MGGHGDRPKGLENRWWVDQQKDERGQLLPRPPAQFGHTFFRSGDGYEQNRAQRRLTDLNHKWFDEAPAPPDGGFALLALVERDFFPRARFDKIRAVLTVPPGGLGVLVDSGISLRAIVTNSPNHERLVELRFGAGGTRRPADDNSFDAWVHGEWVREVIFRHFDDALRRAPRLVQTYLTTDRGAAFC